MKTLHLFIIAIVLLSGTYSAVFAQSDDIQIQNTSSSTNLKCIDAMTQNMKTKYASFDEGLAKTQSLNYDKFKSEVKDDKYTFRAISQGWTNDQAKCDATLKDVLVLFSVIDSFGKNRDVTVIIDPVSYKPQGIDVKNDTPIHGGVIPQITSIDPEFNLLYHKSPLKQFKSGIASKDVKCHDDFLLTIKAENGSPACVKPETAKMLYVRGWALVLTIKLDNSSSNQPVDVISIQSVSSLTNPGGPPIQLTLKNIGLTPITSLKATLHLNNDYDFDFQNVSKSQPLSSGNLISDTKILIGGGFSSDSSYSITISGIENDIPFNYTQNIHIPYTNENSVKYNSSVNTRLPASFMPCNTPYPKSNTGITVLYMPLNSTGRICIQYSNQNSPETVGMTIFEANHILEKPRYISFWPDNQTIPTGNSTVVYGIKTENHAGFYGVAFFCTGMPLAVGYDNDSKLVSSDFPWLTGTYYCPMQSYNFQITGTSGIGVKFIPNP